MGSLQNPQEERAGVSTRAAERKRRRREDETSPERERRQIGSRERMRTFRARIRGEPEAAEMAVREAGRLRRRRAEERDAERTGRRRVQWEHGRSIGQNVASMSRPETVQENYLGLMNKECEFCHALFFESEVGRDPHRINVCCNYGTVQLSDTFGDTPKSFSSCLPPTPNVQRTSVITYGGLIRLWRWLPWERNWIFQLAEVPIAFEFMVRYITWRALFTQRQVNAQRTDRFTSSTVNKLRKRDSTI
uniref:Uncharacterized protein n=1 Tax=Trichuris muris TaxID=70415 RepID=A0A5S6Q1L0_TRIMR